MDACKELSVKGDSSSEHSPDGEWMSIIPHPRRKISVCQNISHLLYQFHSAKNHALKFGLSTYCGHLGPQYRGSTITTMRLIMAIDPDFLALMLRSSLVVASCALSLSSSLVCDKETAIHMSTLLPHVTRFLSFLTMEHDVTVDPTTRAMLERSGCTLNALKARLSSECLSFLTTIATHLGYELIHTVSMDVIELQEPVDILNKEMFDLDIEESGKQCDGSITLEDGYSAECYLCSLIGKKDYKEERLQLDQLYSDLDVLAAAHLEETRMRSSEAKDYRDDTDTCMGDVLLNVGKWCLDRLSNEGNVSKELITTYMASIHSVLSLIPPSHITLLISSCMSCNNFDVMLVLFSLCRSKSGSFADVGIRLRLSNAAVNLLDKNLHRANSAAVNSFLAKMLEYHGLDAIHHDEVSDNAEILVKKIIAVVRRSEIEIHLALDDFFRNGKVEHGVSSSFMLLESLLVKISENESLLPSCHALFTTTHRIITTVFDFFDEVTEGNRESAKELLTCCSRLVGCWMTLEPMHLRTLYLSKLPKILSVISLCDFKWLLPSFTFFESVDIGGIPALLSLVLKTLEKDVAALKHEADEKQETLRSISMSYRFMDRIFLDGMNDVVDMLLHVESPTDVSFHNIKGFDYHKALYNGTVHFSPGAPLGMMVPLCLDLKQASPERVKMGHIAKLVQSWFVDVLHHEHHELSKDVIRGECIDLSYIQDKIAGDMTTMVSLKHSWSQLLSEAALGTADVCLCRLDQKTVTEFMFPSMDFIIMECLVLSFFYMSPEGTVKAMSFEDESTEIWLRISVACVVLLQRQPLFINVVVSLYRKLKFKVPVLKSAILDNAVEEGLLSAECQAAADFMCTLLSNIH